MSPIKITITRLPHEGQPTSIRQEINISAEAALGIKNRSNYQVIEPGQVVTAGVSFRAIDGSTHSIEERLTRNPQTRHVERLTSHFINGQEIPGDTEYTATSPAGQNQIIKTRIVGF